MPWNCAPVLAGFHRVDQARRFAESHIQRQHAAELLNDDFGEKFAAMEKQEEIDRLLADLKAKSNAGLQACVYL
jgi:hypothetical protein